VQSRKRHGGFSILAAENRRSAIDPEADVPVTPAKAGAQSLIGQRVPRWVPAFAGMTRDGSKATHFPPSDNCNRIPESCHPLRVSSASFPTRLAAGSLAR